MDVKEIVYKERLELHEITFVISEFIREKKGVDVAVIVKSEITHQFNPIEYQLLLNAYNTAADYFIIKYPKSE